MKLFKNKLNNGRVLCAVFGMIFFMSCNKEGVVEEVQKVDQGPPQFEVTTAKTTYKVGEQVTFNISGDAGILDFWSGKYGNDYDYRDGRLLPGPAEIMLEFRIREQYQGVRTGSIFSILVSSDFDGDRTVFEDVDAATWTDITDKFVIADVHTNTGKVNIGEFRDGSKPLYVALRYIVDPNLGNGEGTWPQISWMTVESIEGGESVLLSGPLTSDFPMYSAASSNKDPLLSLNRYYDSGVTSNIVVIQRNTSTSASCTYCKNAYTKEYFVSTPYQVGETELGPDMPVTLTNLSEPIVGSHSVTYTLPGVYKVKFIGTDPAISEGGQVIKEFEITVVE